MILVCGTISSAQWVFVASGSQTAWCGFGKALVITLTSLSTTFFPTLNHISCFSLPQLLHSLPRGLCTLSFAYSASSTDITMTNFSFLNLCSNLSFSVGFTDPASRKITPSVLHLSCFHSFLLATCKLANTLNNLFFKNVDCLYFFFISRIYASRFREFLCLFFNDVYQAGRTVFGI